MKEFIVSDWKQEGDSFRIDIKTENDEKLLIQVYKLLGDDTYVKTQDVDAVIMRLYNSITIGTKHPFEGYIVFK